MPRRKTTTANARPVTPAEQRLLALAEQRTVRANDEVGMWAQLRTQILMELSARAQVNMVDFLKANRDGTLTVKSIAELKRLPEAAQRMLKTLKIKSTIDGQEITLGLHDSNRALDRIIDLLGLTAPAPEQRGGVLEDLSDEALREKAGES